MEGNGGYPIEQRVRDMAIDQQHIRLRISSLEYHFALQRFANRKILLLEEQVSELQSVVRDLHQLLTDIVQNMFDQAEMIPHSDGESSAVSNQSMQDPFLRLRASSSDNSSD